MIFVILDDGSDVEGFALAKVYAVPLVRGRTRAASRMGGRV